MKFYRNIWAAALVTGSTLGLLGCKDFYDVNVDPLNTTTATPQLLLPGVQAAMATYLGLSNTGLGEGTSTLVNQYASGPSYGANGSSFEFEWRNLYTSCLYNNELIITQATAQNRTGYLGIAQIQKAYVFSEMVDMWGDIPFSEALQGVKNQAPHFDHDYDIYKGVLALLDSGIGNLQQALTSPSALSTVPQGADLMYQGNLNKWIALANTVKLKLLVQIRKNPTLVMTDAELNTRTAAVLAQPMIAPTDDFEFQYYASVTPENRHPGFQGNYASTSRTDLIGRFFYSDILKPRADPRIAYYLYNQTAPGVITSADYQDGPFVTTLLFSNSANASSSIGTVQTMPGLFAVGGKYDNGLGGVADVNSGAGTTPQRLVTQAARYFLEAEARLMILKEDPTTGAVRTAYENGIRASFAKVNEIAAIDGAPVITSAAIDAYVATALVRYDGSASPTGARPTSYDRGDALTDVQQRYLYNIIEEKYVAGFGFGEDIYTDYRRTGFPYITKPGTTAEPRTVANQAYPRRLPYRQSELISNPNAPAQPNIALTRLFWDN